MSAVNTDALGMLTAMGFAEEEARVALLRSNNDVSHAVELLSNGLSEEGDNEFDLLPTTSGPQVQAPTVFQGQQTARHDHFTDGVTQGTLSEILDARVAYFTDMGFPAAKVEEALQRCHNDVDAALTLLLEECPPGGGKS